MKKAATAVLPLLVIAGAFLVGSWYGQRVPVTPATASPPEIVHHVDATHSAHASHAPGIAPASEMPSSPAHVHGSMAIPGGSSVSVSPGTVQITLEKQQLLGMRVSMVEKAAGTHTVRLLGRVAPDETRVYRVIAGIEGFILEVSPVTTGSHVEKNQPLATFSAPDSIAATQNYIVALDAMDRLRQGGGEGPAQARISATSSNFQQRLEKLRNLGMSVLQMEEIKRTREIPENIKILAPADGFVLARTISTDQKFERGTEFFRIADLRHVWIVADVFPPEAQQIRPGQVARVTLPDEPGVAFPARVSQVLSQFDAATRTLKVRLEADNPGYRLRPDMFVDVELPVSLPPAVVVPVDAVLDSGLKKTIFVDRGEGIFEPRQVETGWRIGDRVEVVKGVTPGERIVVSGTFLLDSESRLKGPTAGTNGTSNEVMAVPTGHEHGPHGHGGHQP